MFRLLLKKSCFGPIEEEFVDRTGTGGRRGTALMGELLSSRDLSKRGMNAMLTPAKPGQLANTSEISRIGREF